MSFHILFHLNMQYYFIDFFFVSFNFCFVHNILKNSLHSWLFYIYTCVFCLTNVCAAVYSLFYNVCTNLKNANKMNRIFILSQIKQNTIFYFFWDISYISTNCSITLFLVYIYVKKRLN